jgi:hypothetical protein
MLNISISRTSNNEHGFALLTGVAFAILAADWQRWTSPPSEYKYNKVADVSTQSSFVFTVRGYSDAHILLTDDDGSEPIEIVIGGWGNTASMIRRGVQTFNPECFWATNDVISPNSDRTFWISWTTTFVRVGVVCIVGNGHLRDCCPVFMTCQNTGLYTDSS